MGGDFTFLRMFRYIPGFTAVTGVKGIGDAHYVKRENIYGTKKGSIQSVVHADYNQEIENIRSFIENVNTRLKYWKVMKGPRRRDRYNVEFFSSCVMSVCGLLNLQIDIMESPFARTSPPYDLRLLTSATPRK